jgi:L-asparaginase/Glu-tRNA(Gln) amidotransferase subunit D
MALALGAISSGDMTIEAAVMKLGVLVGTGAAVDDVRTAFALDWAGERS